MPLFLLTILPVLKKIWLPIVLVFTLIGVLTYTYYKGYQTCENKMNKIIIKEQLKQEEELTELSNKYRHLLNSTNSKSTLLDKEISCILSNNPFKKECK